MPLRIRNNYGPRIWIAIMLFDPVGCAEAGQWSTRGWYAADNGGEAHVLDTNNTFAYYYAEAADGAVWSGPFGPICVPQTAISSCLFIGQTGARIVGLRSSSSPAIPP
jgi:hypothetical protein